MLDGYFHHTTTNRQHTLQVCSHGLAPLARAVEAEDHYIVYALHVFAVGISVFSAVHVTVSAVVSHEVLRGILDVSRQGWQPNARREDLEVSCEDRVHFRVVEGNAGVRIKSRRAFPRISAAKGLPVEQRRWIGGNTRD